jgi:hypothetical protein
MRGIYRQFPVILSTICILQVSGVRLASAQTSPPTSGYATIPSPLQGGVDASYSKGLASQIHDLAVDIQNKAISATEAARQFERIRSRLSLIVMTVERRQVRDDQYWIPTLHYMDTKSGLDWSVQAVGGDANGFGVGLRYTPPTAASSLGAPLDKVDVEFDKVLYPASATSQRVDRRKRSSEPAVPLPGDVAPLTKALETLQKSVDDLIDGSGLRILGEYRDTNQERGAALGVGQGRIFPIGTPGKSERGLAINAGGVLRWLYSDGQGDRRHRAQWGIVAALQWPFTPRVPGMGDDPTKKNFRGWRVRLGLEYSQATPTLGDPYIGGFLSLRPIKSVDVQLFSRLHGSPAIWGVKLGFYGWGGAAKAY